MRVSGLGFRVQGLGGWVSGLGVEESGISGFEGYGGLGFRELEEVGIWGSWAGRFPLLNRDSGLIVPPIGRCSPFH